jgi:anti-sigma factor RsiW
MSCKNYEIEMMNRLMDTAGTAVTPRDRQFAEHLAACPECAEEMLSLQKTMDMLEAWKAPEPSAYFDQKLAVLLREEQAKPAAGWLEKLRERLLFNTGRQFRPALAGALALVLILGGGTFAGVTIYGTQPPVQASAAVNDLQILDKNDQAIQQMDQLLQDDDSSDSGTTAQPSS